ncbi:hypothetical protein, partial [Mycobacterium sp. ST-F2]|uniref:hypothetical protein n=1 Tax=Mycobacterium sp. ST-F2 TaxID=1490484 RepID=UPI00114F456C
MGSSFPPAGCSLMVRRVGRDGDGAALRAFLLANAQAVLQSTLDGPGYRHGCWPSLKMTMSASSVLMT